MKPSRFASLLGLALVGALLWPAGALASRHHGSAVEGHVYVDDNTSGENTIAAFDRHADGTLTPLPGSPFAAGGEGTGAGLASQGALQLSADGRYLLAVDAGSSQISVLQIEHDGSLRLASSSPASSGGEKPVTIAVHGPLVYVGNAGASDSNYTGFVLNPGGHLRPLSGSTFPLPAGAQPGDVLFNSSGANLVGARVAESKIDSFSVSSAGLLTPAAGSPFEAQGAGPFGSEFRPTNPSQLFVSNAHGGPGKGTVSAFSVAADGTLSSIGGSPFADEQTAPCWVEITHDGSFLFTVNTAVGSVSRYQIEANGVLTLLGSTTLKGGETLGSVDARLSPDGGTLYVVDSKAAAVSALVVSGGDLSELASSPTLLPTGATPAGIVVD
jgi:6-phosphogluconolactonase (cycloisomerase 2 family)